MFDSAARRGGLAGGLRRCCAALAVPLAVAVAVAGSGSAFALGDPAPAPGDAGPGVTSAAVAPGYSGLGLTPTPTPARWGQILLGYDTALPGSVAAARGHNLLVGVGLLPGLEITGRLATNNLQCNSYGLGDDPCRTVVSRDLSASIKLGRRFEWSRWPGLGVSAAVGATDLGGAATLYRSYYGVVGLDRGRLALNLGFARSVSSQAPLQGAFAALAWRPAEALQLQAERIGHRHWLGAKLMLPARWRPASVQPWLQVQHSLQNDGFTPRQWWSAGLSLQLDRPDAGRAALRTAADAAPRVSAPPSPGDAGQFHRASAPEPGAVAAAAGVPDARGGQALGAAHAQAVATTSPAVPGPTPEAWARRLAQGLAQAGFEDIAVGPLPGAVVVQAENSGYAWNDLDALGVALGLATREPRQAPAAIDLRITRRGIVVLRVLGGAPELAAWLQGADTGRPPRFLAGAHARPAADSTPTTWWVHGERASFGRLRLKLAPDLDSRVGTEYGTFDVSAGVDLTLQLPLWRGALADVAYVQALGHSADYDRGQVFEDFRIDSQLYRVMLHQAVDIAPGLAARVSAGRLFKRLDGAHLELRWQPGDGAHRLGLDVSRFSHTEVDFHKRLTMGSYRYFVAPIQTALEVQAGQFWHGDRGAVLSSKHWFGDVSVALVFRRSRFPAGSPALYSPYGNHWVQAAGVEFAFPLTPRREHVGRWLQLRGQERFSYGVQSVVGHAQTNNLTPWFGRFAPVPMGLLDTVDNFDRGAQVYLDSNLHRVREAWRALPTDPAP